MHVSAVAEKVDHAKLGFAAGNDVPEAVVVEELVIPESVVSVSKSEASVPVSMLLDENEVELGEVEVGVKAEVEAGMKAEVEAGVMGEVEAGVKGEVEAGLKAKVEVEVKVEAEVGVGDFREDVVEVLV